MAKTKITPGPWFVDEGWLDNHVSISAKTHGAIAEVLSDMEPDYTCNELKRLRKQEELRANACLISCAPELLDALETALEWIDAVPSDIALPVMPGFDRDEVNELISRARGEIK